MRKAFIIIIIIIVLSEGEKVNPFTAFLRTAANSNLFYVSSFYIADIFLGVI